VKQVIFKYQSFHLGVGKTSIISQYVDRKTSLSLPTLGACKASKKISYTDEKENIDFTIWDTVGMEKYRSLSQMYYNGKNFN